MKRIAACVMILTILLGVIHTDGFGAGNTVEAQYEKGMSYFVNNDFDNAFSYFQISGEVKGYAPSQNMLGVCYRDGLGTEQNPAEAERYFRLSAEQEYVPAQENLADLLKEKVKLIGKSEKEEIDEAKELFNTNKFKGYKLLNELNANGIISNIELEKYREELYNEAVTQYKSPNYSKARRIFSYLKPYKDSEKYLVLIDRDNYTGLLQLFSFEDAKEIINKYYAAEFMYGKWVTDDEKYYFYVTKIHGGYGGDSVSAKYNLPSDLKEKVFMFEFDEGDYIGITNDYYEKIPLFRFNIISEDKVLAYDISNQESYELYRLRS